MALTRSPHNPVQLIPGGGLSQASFIISLIKTNKDIFQPEQSPKPVLTYGRPPCCESYNYHSRRGPDSSGISQTPPVVFIASVTVVARSVAGIGATQTAAVGGGEGASKTAPSMGSGKEISATSFEMKYGAAICLEGFLFFFAKA